MNKITLTLTFLVTYLLFGHAQKIAISKNDKIRIWSNVSSPEVKRVQSELTVYFPDPAKRNGASVIVCPGGSYAYLGMKCEGYVVAEWLRSLGFTPFVLRYRVEMFGHHFPTEIQDLQRSIQIVRENAEDWHINPDSVGVMGFSAGGHLVGTSAVYYNVNFMKSLNVEPKVSLRPDFVAMLYPVVSMHDSIAHQKSKRNLMGKSRTNKVLEQMLSLEDNVREGMPPIFIMCAKGDKLVDYRNSLYFYQQLIVKNNQAKFIMYDCEGHGFGINTRKNPIASQWTHVFEEWFSTLNKK
jgi:acetyl esterase/lipase